MSDPFAAINEAFRNGTPLPAARPYKRVPIREPQPLCLCGHKPDGHGSIGFSKPRCLNCRCDGFRDSGTTEDPDQIPYRLVAVPTEGDQVT